MYLFLGILILLIPFQNLIHKTLYLKTAEVIIVNNLVRFLT